ncbi:MAG TPA: tetratricopeptide repeat protein [Candidatus Eremiobacteraceae bacterium]|nr:tetratricopeptide repeat protein [Candidatus Eremiobacteraceae bacterium]
MSNRCKAFALAALFVFSFSCLLVPKAAAQGKISGTIIDFDGKPWADLPVNVKSDQGAAQDTKTDANGKYLFANLRPGKYTVSVHPPQVKDPFTTVTEVHGTTETPPVNWNFKEILEKQSPEEAAKMKKQEEQKTKFTAMKQHFDQGMALLDQEKAAKADLSKVTPDQRDAAKAKVTDLSNQAAAEFQEAQKAAPEKDPNINLFWARMGEAYDVAGRNDEAINAYQQAIANKPDNAGYYNNLGNVLARAGKIDDAKAAYTKSAELDPANAAMAWRNFGISLYSVNRMQDAIEPLQKATQLDPKNAQGWYLLGTCMVADPSIYKQVGDKIQVTPKPGTAEAFQKAIALDPNGPIGAQAKAGLEQLNALTGGISTKIGGKKKS